MIWEFRYVRLEMEPEYTEAEAYDRRVAVIAQVGSEGWEPVGEVTFSHAPPAVPGTTPQRPAQLRRLMFKRPVQEKTVETVVEPASTTRRRGRRS